jgi:GT2 family glycosyltransferase
MRSEGARITTIIPTYRRPDLLRRAIHSVLAQTYPHLRVCVYDNASGDETAAVVAAIAAEDARVSYHCHAANIGAAANFVYGMERVETPYFSILTDDDYYLPGFYETVMAGFGAHPEAICSGGGTVTVTERGSVVWSSSADGYFTPTEGFRARMTGTYPLIIGYVFRKEAIEQVGVMDPALLYADIDYEVRLFSHFPHVITKKPCAIVILHTQQATKGAPVAVALQGYTTLHDRFQTTMALSPEQRAQSEEMLLRVFGSQMLLNIGLPALFEGDFARAHQAAEALRTPFHMRGKAAMLNLLVTIARRISVLHRPITLLLLMLQGLMVRLRNWKERAVRRQIEAYLPTPSATVNASTAGMRSERIAVVVLTWNNRQYTLDCLRSLEKQTIPHTVYLVDNASTDDTAAAVAALFPTVHLIINARNLGFAAGNNAGMEAAFAGGADSVLILNNDTILAPDALEQLMGAARACPGAGILTSLILSAYPPHRVQAAGATIDRWTGRSYCRKRNAAHDAVSDDVQRVAGVMGCAMLITRACFERIGGFNSALFLYFEDTEYAIRASDAGFSILLVPRSRVYHYGSVSSGVKSPSVIYFMTRNSIVTMDRLRPLPAALAVMRRLIIMLVMLCWMLMPPRGAARIQDMLQGYRDARRQRLGPRDSTSGPW